MSADALRQAVCRGKLRPKGRRGGGKGTNVYAIEDLERFMTGGRVDGQSSGVGEAMGDGAVLPGVWKRKDGGHVVRSRPVDPRSGKPVEILKALTDEDDPKRALAWLTAERDRIRRGETGPAQEIPIWKSFAASLFESKVEDKSINTASGRKKWARILEHHLFTAPWAVFYVDKVTHADLIDWRNSLPKMSWTRYLKNRKGEYLLNARGERIVGKRADRCAPSTMNDWLNIARVIWKAARHKYQLPFNPMDGVEDFSTDAHRTYTEEEPNSLTDEETFKWLAVFKEGYPQFYAMVFLGLVLGHRPSTLRPLRRKGAQADLNFGKGTLLVRRSNTESDEVEDFTKTKRDQTVYLPDVVLDVLKWHIDTQLETERMRESELLFPTRDGGFRSRSCLDKPFARVTRLCGIKKKITPRALRRTFKDLSRLAGIVAKAISGHQTDAMHLLYSTAQVKEVQTGIARVVDIASRRPRKTKRQSA